MANEVVTHYVMVGEGTHPIMPIASGPTIDGNGRLGCAITEPVPEPLVYQLDSDLPGRTQTDVLRKTYAGHARRRYRGTCIGQSRKHSAFQSGLVNPRIGERHRERQCNRRA
jgi:hypothetical protein